MSELHNKTVIVTGATGLIGSNLVRRLMSMGDVYVIAVGRSKEKLEKAFDDFLNNNNFEIKIFDISEKYPYIERFVDYIFHTAGPMESEVIQDKPVDVIKPNVYGTINSFEFLRGMEGIFGKKGRLIIFSSVTVYSNSTNRDLVVEESDTCATDKLGTVGAVYSQSKRISEVIANAYIRQFGCDAVIARLSTVYGETVFHPDTAFFQFIDSAISKKNILINVSGIGRRDNLYIDDAIDGLILVALRGKTGEAYNVSSNGELGNFAAVDEVARIILHESDSIRVSSERLGLKVEFKDGGINYRKPGLRLDNNKLKSLGWSVKTSLTDGIRKTLNTVFERQQEINE